MAHVIQDKFGTPLGDTSLAIALGMWPGVQGQHKFFGGTVSVSNTTISDVTSNTTYQWLDPSSFGAISLTSTSSQDAIGGGGNPYLHVFGVTNSYDFRDEAIILDGLNAVTTEHDDYIHVWRMHGGAKPNGTDVNSIQEAGDLNATIAGLTLSKIHQGNGQTLSSPFIVPRGFTAAVKFGKVSVGKGKSINGCFHIRETAINSDGTLMFGPDRTAHEFNLLENSYDYPFSSPLPVPSMYRIEVQASVDAQTARVSGGYDITLWPDNFNPNS